MHRLIIVADDFGYGFSRNCGIVECFQKQGISAVSVLANGKHSYHAVELAQQYNIPAGLHFNLTEGLPLSNPAHISSLVSPQGMFLGKSEFWSGLNYLPTHVEYELNAQINWFKNVFGIKPRHVDGHQHVHLHPSVVNKFAETLAKHCVNTTRLPIEHECSQSNKNITLQRKEFHNRIDGLAKTSIEIFNKYKIKRTDAFVGLNLMGSMLTQSNLQRTLRDVFDSGVNSCELMVHPGYKCDEHSDGFVGDDLADAFSCSSDREYELETLISDEMINFYNKNNICLQLHPINKVS